MGTKSSPFVLTQESLERLQRAALAAHEPAVVQLVGWYQQAQADATQFAEMIEDEMEHFGVNR